MDPSSGTSSTNKKTKATLQARPISHLSLQKLMKVKKEETSIPHLFSKAILFIYLLNLQYPIHEHSNLYVILLVLKSLPLYAHDSDKPC